MLPFDDLTTKPISCVFFPSFLRKIWVGMFEIRVKKRGPLVAPLVKLSPKVPIKVLFCLKAITFDSHPLDPVSVIVTDTQVVAGHAPKMQNS